MLYAGRIRLPSKSPAQEHMMAAVAHNPDFAKKVGIPQAVCKEFNEADAAKKKFKRKSSSEMAKGMYKK